MAKNNLNKVSNLLGLAKRAGKLVFGTDAVLKNLNKNKTKLIVLATDSSDALIDKVEKKAFYYKIPVLKKYSTDTLAHALGVENPKVIGINDIGFTKAVLAELEREGNDK